MLKKGDGEATDMQSAPLTPTLKQIIPPFSTRLQASIVSKHCDQDTGRESSIDLLKNRTGVRPWTLSPRFVCQTRQLIDEGLSNSDLRWSRCDHIGKEQADVVKDGQGLSKAPIPCWL
jgi:hypothetical protein